MSAETIVVLILGILFFGGIGFLIRANHGNSAPESNPEQRRPGEGERIAPPAGRNLRRASRG